MSSHNAVPPHLLLQSLHLFLAQPRLADWSVTIQVFVLLLEAYVPSFTSSRKLSLTARASGSGRARVGTAAMARASTVVIIDGCMVVLLSVD